jgi:hypothetical protein
MEKDQERIQLKLQNIKAKWGLDFSQLPEGNYKSIAIYVQGQKLALQGLGTFQIREVLKANGFKFNGAEKMWVKVFNLGPEDMERVSLQIMGLLSDLGYKAQIGVATFLL